jgi:hypothetical protein
MAIATFVERDRQIAAMIKDEIATLKQEQQRFGWAPHSGAWNRAFGKMSGLYTILALIEPVPFRTDGEMAKELMLPAEAPAVTNG